ncbi:MAG: fibrobacter succinogenes major paralogous domain-containing protein [Prolixibacteraceae bacterium]|nr:fibrobacter succinogenes major paralogous domain-containing protein [Prolixibacteraceae bacterium]
MKKKTNLFSLLLMTGLAVILTYSCSKSNDSNNPTSDGGTVTDIDGNVYHTVTIGTQVWMVENLKTTKYRNGDTIPNITGNAAWAALTTGALCWYNNDAATYKANYGALYNWFAVADSRKIAPSGWHVPSDAEWTTLTTFLGGESVAGGKLKETGSIHWLNLNIGATNSSGFTALPGGLRSDYNYRDIGNCGHWWSSTDIDTDQAWSRTLVDKYAWVGSRDGYYSKRFGFSVRCVRD